MLRGCVCDRLGAPTSSQDFLKGLVISGIGDLRGLLPAEAEPGSTVQGETCEDCRLYPIHQLAV